MCKNETVEGQESPHTEDGRTAYLCGVRVTPVEKCLETFFPPIAFKIMNWEREDKLLN